MENSVTKKKKRREEYGTIISETSDVVKITGRDYRKCNPTHPFFSSLLQNGGTVP